MKGILFQVKDLEKIILRKLEPAEFEKQDLSELVQRPTPTQMQILGYIIDNKYREVYQRDLEEKLNLRRSTISDVLQRMEKNGLIVRKIDSTDTRTKKIILTEKSREFFLTANNRMSELEKVAIKNISADELEIFSNVINKMIKNMNKEE